MNTRQTTRRNRRIRPKEVRKALQLLVPGGQVTEVRALNAENHDTHRPTTLSGYFDDPEALVAELEYIEEAQGIYLIPNPVNPALLARAHNRLKPAERGATTTDKDIVARRWLLVDLDPVRPSGISSSDAEHEAALDRARSICNALGELGWPGPVVADSGNGAHLLYRIDLPADDEGLVQRVLQALAFRFDDERVHVDQTTFNPARIWKLYGTRACKGDPTDDRPHRLAQMLEAPDEMIVVRREHLEAVAGWLPAEAMAEARSGLEPAGYGPASGFDLDEWIAEHGLEVEGPYAWQQGGRRWIFPVCPWDEHHADRSAYLVQFPNGAIAAGCHHNGCAGKDWHALRDLVEPEQRSESKPPRLQLLSNRSAESTASDWEQPIPLQHFDLPPFPTAALPGWLRAYVVALAEATQTPPEMAAMLALSVLATCAARVYAVQARPGWVEPLNLYTVTVLPSANRKSPVFSAMTRPLQAVEERLVREIGPEIAQAAGQRRIIEERMRQVESQAARTEDPDQRAECERQAAHLAKELAACVVPVRPRLIADDISPEKVASMLAEQGGRLAILSAEGELFNTIAGRYSSKGVANLNAFLKGHSGDDLRVDRVGREPDYVKHPALTIGLTIQPTVLQGLDQVARLRGQGLFARFLYSWPTSPLGGRRIAPDPVPEHVERCYATQIERLAGLKPNRTSEGEAVPNLLILSPRAEKLLRQLERAIEPHLAPAGSLALMNDWAGKLAGAVVRIAGLFHLAEQEEETWITKPAIRWETLARAIQVGNYLLAHARAAYAEVGADPVIEEASFLLGRIENRGWVRFTKRNLHTVARSRFTRAAQLDRGLEVLVDHGYLRVLGSSSHDRPGRPASPEYEVNPLWLAQKSHNAQNSGKVLDLSALAGVAVDVRVQADASEWQVVAD